MDKSRIADIQNAIVEKFPNISVIDMTETITTFTGISRKLSNTIRFFTAFGILVGMLITVSSVLATRLARTTGSGILSGSGSQNVFRPQGVRP